MSGLVISSGVVLSEADAIPLRHPRILWDDVLRRATFTASSEAEGFWARNICDGLTWDAFKPTAMPATLEIVLPAAEPVDSLLFARHSLGSAACAVKVETHDGSDWVEVMEAMPGSDNAVWYSFDEQFSNRYRLTFSGDTPPRIAVAMLGKALRIPRGVTLNHKPVILQRQTEVRGNKSEGGQTLGRSILRQGVASQIAFEHLDRDWLREKFDPFILSARTYPFGWLWSPEKYPAEAAFLWLPAAKPDIHPEHSGLQDRMNVAFDVEGLVA